MLMIGFWDIVVQWWKLADLKITIIMKSKVFLKILKAKTKRKI